MDCGLYYNPFEAMNAVGYVEDDNDDCVASFFVQCELQEPEGESQENCAKSICNGDAEVIDGCVTCWSKFRTKTSEDTHQLVHDFDIEFPKVLLTKLTDKIMLKHTGRHYCTICLKEFTMRHHLVSHYDVHREHRRFPCELCGKRFKRRVNLRNHQTVHFPIEKYGCDICDERFVHKNAYILHLGTHNAEGEDCKDKSKFLRDGYNRFKKKNKLGTGSASPKNSKDKRHQQLSFLKGISQHRAGGYNVPTSPEETIENADTDHENDKDQVLANEHSELQNNMKNTEMQISDDEVTEVLNDRVNICEEQRTPKCKKRINDDDKLFKLWKEKNDKRQTLLKAIVKKKDGDVELFCRHIAEVLRSLPQVYKAEAKKDLGVVLADYEIMAARNTSNPVSANIACSDFNILSSTPSSLILSSYDFSAPYTFPLLENVNESLEPTDRIFLEPQEQVYNDM